MSNQSMTYLRAFRNHLRDPLYTNSVYIFASRVLSVTTGFVFWMIAARLYSINDVGLGVAMLSSASIINLFSTVGLEHSVIRFSRSYDLGRIVNSSLVIVIIASIIVGLCYGLITLLFPSRVMEGDAFFYLLIFVAFSVISSVGMFTGHVFLAMRKSPEYLVQTIFMSSRVVLPGPTGLHGPFRDPGIGAGRIRHRTLVCVLLPGQDHEFRPPDR